MKTRTGTANWLVAGAYSLLAAIPALAQMDFSGEWSGVRDEDNTGNPRIGEFIGIPMSHAGLLRARSLERVPLHSAGMAMPAARSGVHLARAVAGADLEGSGPGIARDHGVSRRVAPFDRQCLLHGWPPAPATRTRPTPGEAFPPRNSWATC